MDLQDHRPALERDLRVRIREVDHACRALRRAVQELPAIAAQRDVRDHVERLARLAEGALEGVVEVRRHDQLLWRATLS